MKILTIGASPYLLVRNGKMNADVLCYFMSLGHDVSSACWHHDDGYFLPNTDTGECTYEKDGITICNLFPFINHPEHSASQIYEIMKKTAPDIVITIGNYKETDFLHAIKAMYPVFKWIAVLNEDAHPINEYHIEAIDFADYIICTNNEGFDEISKKCNKTAFLFPYGPNDLIYNTYADRNANKNVICTSKNALASNLGNVIKAASQISDLHFTLHTNIFDVGEYDIHLLKERFFADNVHLPQMFVSIKEGIDDFAMREMYCQNSVVLDCSVKSSTALSVLEGMASGCIPVGTDGGRIGEIISLMPEEFRFYVPTVSYIGSTEEEYSIASPESICKVLRNVKDNILSNNEIWISASKAAVEVASKFRNNIFLNGLNKVVNESVNTPSMISLETF